MALRENVAWKVIDQDHVPWRTSVLNLTIRYQRANFIYVKTFHYVIGVALLKYMMNIATRLHSDGKQEEEEGEVK